MSHEPNTATYGSGDRNPAIAEEIDTFEAEALRLRSGDVSSDLFRPFRLQYGIYGQRQADVQMVRIKIPFGGISANQLRRVAELADRHATGVGHVTTRQDIQLHFVEGRALDHARTG